MVVLLDDFVLYIFIIFFCGIFLMLSVMFKESVFVGIILIFFFVILLSFIIVFFL